MKNQKGLTLIGTIFLVILIAFIVFGVIYFFRLQEAKEELEDIKTDMLLVEAKVRKISSDYILEKKDEVLIGTELKKMKDEPEIKQFLEKNLFDMNQKGKKYYILNEDNLIELELPQVKLEENAYYIVEYTDVKVYYTKGFEHADGNIYYAINEIEELKMEE